jgi:hypothetical protein
MVEVSLRDTLMFVAVFGERTMSAYGLATADCPPEYFADDFMPSIIRPPETILIGFLWFL